MLDTAGEAGVEGGEGGVQFNSLDELVLFLTGHNLKVGEDEVKLTDTCPCVDDTVRLSSNCMLYRSYNTGSVSAFVLQL